MNLPDNMTLKATVEKPNSNSGSGSETVTSTSLSDIFSWPGRIALLVAVVLAPWALGSVDFWAQRWITICLLVGLGFWWFETALNRRNTQVIPYISLFVFLGLGIALFQTVPLSKWLGDLILGGQQEIYAEFTGGNDQGASISLDRQGTWGQIRLLIVALSGLLLGCRYFRSKRDMVLLMSVVSINGAVIAFIGTVHKLTSNGKLLWIFDYSRGTPFGPFVNRNNCAGYLLMCLACCVGLIPIVMAGRRSRRPYVIVSKEIPVWRQFTTHFLVFVSELTAAKISVLLACALIASGVVASLSRGGVVALLVGSIGTLLVYGMARKPANVSLVVLPLLGLVAALSGWVGFGDQLVQRFDKIDIVNISEADGRVQHWLDTWPAVGDMGVFGAGLGSYSGVHRLYRTGQENSLFIYAENQFFQAAVEAGWPGLILFLLAWLLAYHYAAVAIFRGSSPTTVGVGTMGVFLVLSQAVASFFDFGLYIAANMLLIAVLVGFLGYHAHSLAGRLKKRSWLRTKMPNYVIQVVVLIMFACTTMVAIDFDRRAKMDVLLRPAAKKFTRENMGKEVCDLRIAQLEPMIKRTPTVEALDYAGELWMHRCRISMYEAIVNDPQFVAAAELMSEEEKAKRTQNYWSLTDIQQLQENVFYLRREGSRYEVSRFLNRPPIRENLPVAINYFIHSRNTSPIAPVAHLRIGEIQGVIGKPRDGDVDIERALRLAPSNGSFRKVAGVYYLQSGNVEAAVPHLRKCLDLLPSQFNSVMELITGRTTRNIEEVSAENINSIIPDRASLILRYVTEFLPADSPEKPDLLLRAAKILESAPHVQRENLILLGDIRVEQGNAAAAEEKYRAALTSQPNDPKTRYKRAELLVLLGRLDEALEEAKYLKSHSRDSQSRKKAIYNKLIIDVELAIEKREQQREKPLE